MLGPVVVGHCSKIGAGSVVATDLPPHVVAGERCAVLAVPAVPAVSCHAFTSWCRACCTPCATLLHRTSKLPFSAAPTRLPAPPAVGVPAKVIKRLDEFEQPVQQMDQVGAERVLWMLRMLVCH